MILIIERLKVYFLCLKCNGLLSIGYDLGHWSTHIQRNLVRHDEHWQAVDELSENNGLFGMEFNELRDAVTGNFIKSLVYVHESRGSFVIRGELIVLFVDFEVEENE